MSFEIIEVEPSSHAVVADLHTRSWQASYAGILPDDYLQNRVTAERSEYWQRAMAAGDYTFVLQANDTSGPVGFVAVKLGLDEGYDARIEHLHVLPGMKERGLAGG